MLAKIIILDESVPVRTVAGAMLRHGGFEVCVTDSLDEARRLIAESECPVLLLLSSTLACRIGGGVNALVNGCPHAAVTLMCTQPASCPLIPGPCPDLGCIRKPDDMVAARLVGRVRQILERNDPLPVNIDG